VGVTHPATASTRLQREVLLDRIIAASFTRFLTAIQCAGETGKRLRSASLL
jgi:hypothetical protein